MFDTRNTALGGTARGTLAAVARSTSLRPYPEDISFTGISRDNDKYLWFLEAHLHAKR